MAKIILLLVIILLTSCSFTRIHNYPINLPNITSKTFYVDCNFNDTEQKLIIEAGEEWTTATRGMVRFYFIFNQHIDKDFTKYEDKDININFLVKFNSDDQFIKDKDYNQKVAILGFTTTLDNGMFYIGMVFDRMTYANKYKDVIIHEFGHSLRLKHIEDGPAIMNAVRNKFVHCLTEYDLQEFCLKYQCNVEDTNYCDPDSIINQIIR